MNLGTAYMNYQGTRTWYCQFKFNMVNLEEVVLQLYSYYFLRGDKPRGTEEEVKVNVRLSS
jgi:hypothetical protein